MKNMSIMSKTMKYLGITLIKEVKDLYTDNYKSAVKMTVRDRNKWNDISRSQIRRLDIVKMFT